MNLSTNRSAFPFESSDELKDHARELNRMRREDELRQARKACDATTRIFRRISAV